MWMNSGKHFVFSIDITMFLGFHLGVCATQGGIAILSIAIFNLNMAGQMKRNLTNLGRRICKLNMKITKFVKTI